MASTIEVRDLRRTYGDVTAVDGISFEVAEGEIFGLVGPNGAGKTTTIECVEGLRRPTSGHVRVLGMDPAGERREVAERIGIQLQESALPARLRVEEALGPSTDARSVPMTSWACWRSPRNEPRHSPNCRADRNSACSSLWRWSTGPSWCSSMS